MTGLLTPIEFEIINSQVAHAAGKPKQDVSTKSSAVAVRKFTTAGEDANAWSWLVSDEIEAQMERRVLACVLVVVPIQQADERACEWHGLAGSERRRDGHPLTGDAEISRPAGFRNSA